MSGYIVRRLIQAVFVLILVSLIVFLIMRILPGDPLTVYITQQDIGLLTPEQMAKLRHEFGLDKSLAMQYVDWISGLFRGDLGTSIHYGEPVIKLMAERLPVTLYLGGLAFALSGFFGILFGLVAALRRGQLLDTCVTSLGNIGVSAPHFWLGILMIYGFGLGLRWLPIQGYTSPFEDFWLSTRQLIMPILVLATFATASTTRQTRSSMLEVVRQDYIRTARSKGLREQIVVMRHVLKNGLIPVVTLMGMQASHILGGSVVVETVFSIPGMGRLMVSAVFSQDYQVVQGGILIIAVVVVLANLIVDISYAWLDPRIMYN